MTRFSLEGRAGHVVWMMPVLLVMLLATVPFGCQTGTTPPPEGEVTAVTMEDFAFHPAEVTIKVGDTVEWTNLDSVQQTTTSGTYDGPDPGELWDSGMLGTGGSFDFKFEQPGEYLYFSRPYPATMTGRVIVTAG